MSVFSSFSNATMGLSRALPGFRTVGRNQIPNSEIVHLRVMVKEKAEPVIAGQIGAIDTLPTLEGYFIDPIPPGVTFPQVVQIAYDTGDRGEMRITLKVPSPFYDQVEILGQPFYLAPPQKPAAR